MSNPLPELPKSIAGWIVNHTKANYWRVAGWYEFDDLLQDGFMVAYKCRGRYPDAEDKHLMALVKTAFWRHITELMRQKHADVYYQKPLMTLVADAKSEDDVLQRLKGQDFSIAELNVFLNELPSWVQKALQLISTPEGLRKLYRSRPKLDGPVETLEDRFRRLTGMPENVHDFEAELLAYVDS